MYSPFNKILGIGSLPSIQPSTLAAGTTNFGWSRLVYSQLHTTYKPRGIIWIKNNTLTIDPHIPGSMRLARYPSVQPKVVDCALQFQKSHSNHDRCKEEYMCYSTNAKHNVASNIKLNTIHHIQAKTCNRPCGEYLSECV